MTTTIMVENGKIFINDVPLKELLSQVYEAGKNHQIDANEKITFQKLSKQLAEKGRIVSVKTLTQKARNANVKTFPFDGKRIGCYLKDVHLFISF